MTEQNIKVNNFTLKIFLNYLNQDYEEIMSSMLDNMFCQCPFEGYSGKRGMTGNSDPEYTLALAMIESGMINGVITYDEDGDLEDCDYSNKDVYLCWSEIVSLILENSMGNLNV